MENEQWILDLSTVNLSPMDLGLIDSFQQFLIKTTYFDLLAKLL